MSDVNEDTIKNLSRLSRIEIKDEEIPLYLSTLKQLLDYFSQLQEVDVSEISPYSHVAEQGIKSLREDDDIQTLSRDKFLANAPDHVGGMVRVPPVFKPGP